MEEESSLVGATVPTHAAARCPVDDQSRVLPPLARCTRGHRGGPPRPVLGAAIKADSPNFRALRLLFGALAWRDRPLTHP